MLVASPPPIALPGSVARRYLPGMDALTLPPDLESFVADAVARGRYRDASDVVRAGVRLLQRAETERANLVASLERAASGGERDGVSTIEDVEWELDAIIEAAGRRRG